MCAFLWQCLCASVWRDVLSICGLCYVSHTLLMCASLLVLVYSSWEECSCMILVFHSGRWRDICQSGCEDRIYCLMASAQDEVCEGWWDTGKAHPPFAAARKEEGAPRVAVTTGGCRTRKTWASEDNASNLEMLQKWCVWNCFESADDSSFSPLNWMSLLGNIRLNFTYWPKLTYLQSPALLSYCC